MADTPGFRYMGGKYRLRKWLISKFPAYGRTYIEPFCGRCNVYFLAKKALHFVKWHLNDLNILFIQALKLADLSKLPEKVCRGDFDFWKQSNDVIAELLVPMITFSGSGYAAGYVGDSKHHSPYCGSLYRRSCRLARKLLDDAIVTNNNYRDLDYGSLTREDFAYFDPPYYGTTAHYSNIDHEDLIRLLNEANFRWAVSGYDNELYRERLKYTTCYKKVRNAELKGMNTGGGKKVVEVLWTNYCESSRPTLGLLGEITERKDYDKKEERG